MTNNQNNKALAKYPGKSLRRTILFWFLTLAILPMLLVGTSSYWTSYNAMVADTRNSLEVIATLKTVYMEKFFSRIWTDLRMQANLAKNITLLTYLESDSRRVGRPLAEFVKTPSWQAIVDENDFEIMALARNFEYDDILLIAANGDVLFSVNRGVDLGVNIFSGLLDNSLLAKTSQRVLAFGVQLFSDFELYEPDGGRAAGFFIDQILSAQGDIIGLVAIKISANEINKILQDSTGLGQTGESFLIGWSNESGIRLRSNTFYDEGETVLRKVVNSRLAQRWFDEHILAKEGNKSGEVIIGYSGLRGDRVFGVHKNIKIANVNWGLLVEISQWESFTKIRELAYFLFVLGCLAVLLVIIVSLALTRKIVHPIKSLTVGVQHVAAGDLERIIKVPAVRELAIFADSFNEMISKIQASRLERTRLDWLKTGQGILTEKMRGELSYDVLAENILSFLVKYLDAKMGMLYRAKSDNILLAVAGYAQEKDELIGTEVVFGEGLAGQTALDRKYMVLDQCPADYYKIHSGLGKSVPRSLLLYPIIFDNRVMALVELATFSSFSKEHIEFLQLVEESVAIAFRSIDARQEQVVLLLTTQDQAENLQTQQEELRVSNEELAEQTKSLQISKAKLQTQQENLRVVNEELQERSEYIEKQHDMLQTKNSELEAAHQEVEAKAKTAEMANKYKSEFLANMSHELRTPLNSIILLSKILADNRDEIYGEDVVESADTIHASGADLLKLINDILDLSKVESGKMEVYLEQINIRLFCENLHRQFKALALEKGLGFMMDIADDVPVSVVTDPRRCGQIILNLLANAFKFTQLGQVVMRVYQPEPQDLPSELTGDSTEFVAFAIKDSGIGIPKEKFELIFGSFQQGDGSINRQYGGTGLGLPISREFATLLGGRLMVESTPGTGSIFTLILPVDVIKQPKEKVAGKEGYPDVERKDHNIPPIPVEKSLKFDDISDDRQNVSADDKVILVIEDDPNFAKIMKKMAREFEFKCLLANSGETGLQFAQFYKPSAIILDIGLPGMSGLTVMARLKEDLSTRHIPVHFISGMDEEIVTKKMGAVDFLTKPFGPEAAANMFGKLKEIIEKPVKDLLIVEDEIIEREFLRGILESDDIKITTVTSAEEALEKLGEESFDCVVVDLGLPNMDGFKFLELIRGDESRSHIPVIVYSGRSLTSKECAVLDGYSEKIIIKKTDSHQKLLDEVSLFLHRVSDELPEKHRQIIEKLHDKEAILKDKTILLVDDDMRNVFSLKKLLTSKGVNIIVGKNGAEGVAQLEANPETNLVLMDMMMPIMDGYEAIKKIRDHGRFAKIPILALTAKAMKGDRAKCIESGANDYLAKPIDPDRLLSMLRVWLY